MAWEDTQRGYIQILIDQREWTAAYNALIAYIDKYGEDYWAKNNLALVKANL